MLKVLVVEDSLTAQKLLVSILERDPEISVIGVASSGQEALAMLEKLHPDVITMDIHMPGMNGLEVTRRIMETKPTPIIVVSASCLVSDIERAFQLIEAGALMAVPKPILTAAPDFEILAGRLKQTVKDMSQVKVVRRWPKKTDSAPSKANDLRNEKMQQISNAALTRLPRAADLDLIAIGASTGGPAALAILLKNLDADFPLPILLVQHIAPGFLAGMAQWLEDSLAIKVRVAVDGDKLLPGTLYLAQEGKHLTVADAGTVKIKSGNVRSGHRPSVDVLFASVAEHCGKRAVGILLTGMGADGASELGSMKKAGALTIAQDKESSVVHGMPGEAIKQGAAVHILSLDTIATVLAHIARK